MTTDGPIYVSPFSMIPTPDLIEELKRRHTDLVIVGHLHSSMPNSTKPTHVAHFSGNKLTCLGLLTIASDNLRETLSMKQADGQSPAIYGGT